MWRRTQDSEMMVLLFILSIFSFSDIRVRASPEIIVQNPFYVRARIIDSQTANVLFEIARENDQQTCRMYKFTISRNREQPYSMPEQNLTFWRNSLELKHLAAGDYNICAVICSEKIRQTKDHYQSYVKKDRTRPIIACVNFRAFRPHLLVLTLYILVIIFLSFSQIIFSIRKRQFQARMKVALIEVENSVEKWRTSQPPPCDTVQSNTILQCLVTLPATPVNHSVSQQPVNDEDQHPIIFHLEIPTDHRGSM